MAASVSADSEAQSSSNPHSKRGGWITFPFMISTMFGLCIASGCLVNLIVFLIEEFNIKSIAAAQISNILNGCLGMLPLVAAILADSFFGNIPIISVSAFISLLGIILLTLVSFIDSLRPGPCETGSILCQSPSKLQLGVLYAALALVGIGLSGTRVPLASAGANQYEKPKDQGSFFNWYFLTVYIAGVISATAIVYLQDNASWKLGFGLCAAFNLISFIIFICGKRFYKHAKPMGSPFKSLARVLVVATTNRKALLSSKEEDYYQEHGVDAAAIPTKSFRFLNRAALKTKGDIEPSVNNMSNPCSVQEVEDFKSILRLFPLWLAMIFVGIPIVVQTSLVVLQALVMDRRLGPHFKVSAGSLSVIPMISSGIFISLNNWLVYPMYQKLTKKPLTPLRKVGIGQCLVILSMAISAIVETKRLKTVENEHTMSVLWLLPPLVIVGTGEAFQLPANIELFYREFPKSLKNTGTSLTSLVIGISSYLCTATIDIIQRTTKWLPDDINHGRVDNVYWLLVIGGVLNLAYFLVCALLYKYRNLEDIDQEGKIQESLQSKT